MTNTFLCFFIVRRLLSINYNVFCQENYNKILMSYNELQCILSRKIVIYFA